MLNQQVRRAFCVVSDILLLHFGICHSAGPPDFITRLAPRITLDSAQWTEATRYMQRSEQ